MKKCVQCGELKPLTSFNLIRQKYYQKKCNQCRGSENRKKYKKYFNEYREKNREKNREKDREAKSLYGIGRRTIATFGFKLALQVYDEAERKCSQCKSEYDLTIHHLDGNGRHNQEKGLPMNNEKNNLIVLCRKCHGSIHGKQRGKLIKK